MRSFPRITSVLIAIAVLAVSACLLAAAPSPKATDGDLLKLQHGYFDAIMARKYDSAIDLLADDYTGVYADGIINRAHETKDLKEFPLTAYEMSQEKVTFLGAKVAIVTFRLHVKVTVDGKDFFEDDNLSCVWNLQKKKWRMVSQAAVKVPASSQQK